MGGGGSDSVTQTQKAEPWSVAVPWATSLVGDKGLLPAYQDWGNNIWQQSVFGPGGGNNPFIYNGTDPSGQFNVGNFVAQMNGNQMDALGGTQGLIFDRQSSDPNYSGGAYNWASKILNDASSPNGLNAIANSALNNPQLMADFNNALSGNLTMTGSPWQTNLNTAYGNYFQPTVSGQMLDPSKNQYLAAYGQAAIDPLLKNEQNTLAGINANASSSGRYGSSAWKDLTAKAMDDTNRQVGNTLANIYEPAYQQERGLQQNAANTIQGQYNTEQQNQFNAANMAMQLQNQIFGQGSDAASRMLASGQLDNQTMQALSGLFNQEWNMGTAEQQNIQAGLNAAQQAYKNYYFGPMDFLSGLTSIAYGMPWGNKTSSTPMYQPSFLQSAAGAAGTGLGMYGLTGDPSISALMAGMGMF